MFILRAAQSLIILSFDYGFGKTSFQTITVNSND